MDAIILGVRGLLRAPEDPTTGPAAAAPGSTGIAGDAGRRSALRALAQIAPVALVERGPADALETWAQRSGSAGLVSFRLWTERLGAQARPPSRLPFRFIQRRLDVPCSRSLYIGGDSEMLDAALRAGCQVWDTRRPAGPGVPDSVVDLITGMLPA